MKMFGKALSYCSDEPGTEGEHRVMKTVTIFCEERIHVFRASDPPTKCNLIFGIIKCNIVQKISAQTDLNQNLNTGVII